MGSSWGTNQVLLPAIYLLRLVTMLLLLVLVEIGLNDSVKVTYHWKIVLALDSLWNLILNDERS